jgi:hypothetical protein
MYPMCMILDHNTEKQLGAIPSFTYVYIEAFRQQTMLVLTMWITDPATT